MNIRRKKSSFSKRIVSTFIVSAIIGSLIPIGVNAAAQCNLNATTHSVHKCTKSPKLKNAKIAVISDAHYFAPELGITGSAFEAYLAQDRKLIAESSAISNAVIDELKKSDVKIVLVSGDMTKDGEKLSHLQFSKLLKDLEKSGKKVYVVPGNHDINNPESNSYLGDTATPVENVTPDQFKKIYYHFGFSEAISRDRHSLSYVVEPVPGLRIIAMDSAKYNDNARKTSPVIGGEFSEDTYNWIKKQIKEAKSKGKTVIGLMHHGLLEHFNGQKQYFDEFVINNWEKISEEFADLGMEAVFTGHYHAQDISSKTTTTGNKIYDIETGSLVSYPSPYRIVDITQDKMTVETKNITSIDYDTKGALFQDYAYNYLKTGLKDVLPLMFKTLIMRMNPAIPEEQAYLLGKQAADAQPAPSVTSMTVYDLLSDAMIAHYKGDEELNPLAIAISQGMMASDDPMSQSLGFLLNSGYNDPSEKDNNTVLEFNP
ncbi:metallophosphoesterase family protein [Pseudobacteroides cellulosolvens]|uniref:Calcineurin-like phosphoesterase superfamily domain containing protein n=1 Tax=Pseudobacteroides cellulosolvens ATCC 35603 = DSM 2933 TaxID=398512 RepID=A0A0L6JHR7_9FIRM|nr:metallophosphoesterase [Pseudobacteroides cellulosolvens]KNY25245.1 Calcineurin-like phosphoesterase superfamily domain containing protein [Pseudobacteroides cellulosolvens ATCC 35603 = DSM 2933]